MELADPLLQLASRLLLRFTLLVMGRRSRQREQRAWQERQVLSARERQLGSLVAAIALASGVTSLLEGSPRTVLLGGAVAAGVASLPRDVFWRRGLQVFAVLLLVAGVAVTLLPASDPASSSGDEVLPIGEAIGVGPKGLEGPFPRRRSRLCRVPEICTTGYRPSLNSMVFTGSAFPQGIPDERRFLLARTIPTWEDTAEVSDSLLDPLWVAPGDRIRVIAIVDNTGVEGTAESTARGVRALLAVPTGSGRAHVLLTSIASTNADPPLVSDSVTIRSREPTYLRYEKGSASVLRPGAPAYRLTDALVDTYTPLVDRRRLASAGVRVGCERADGLVPAGRACAFTYRATFEVRYAATPENVNGLGRLRQAPFEVWGKIRSGDGASSLYWSPRWDAPQTDHWVPDGTVALVNCVIRRDGFTWYHLPDAHPDVPPDRHPRGFDTAFAPGSHVTILRNTPSRCAR